ncbi:MAG: hypothetical protein J6V22_01450, partial [Clostridia bacterium]|nr:hypothetical protein [Clostridia bacterium]
MRATLNLLRLQIDNHTDLLKTASPRKMLVSVIKILLLLIAITGALAYGFANIFLLGFAINAELIALVLLIVQGLTLAFTVAHVIGTLYLSRDNELLICLPVTANQFFISKVLLVYFKEFAFNAMLCLPMFICLGIFGGFGISFYCAIPLYLILMPILPIILASFLSIPIMRILAFLKRHSVLAIIVLLVSVASALWAYISLIAGLAGSFNIVEQQLQLVNSINQTVQAIGSKVFVYYQLAQAMLSFSVWYYIPLFLVLCALLSVATVMIIRPFYFRIAMPQLENRVKPHSKKRQKFRHTTAFASLIKKEMLCIFRSPSEVFQYFLFTLLMPFIVISYDRLLMTVSVNQAGVNMIAGSHVMIVAILAMLSNISSASAVSRDGATFHTSKIIPVNYFTQIFAKLTFNAIFTLGAVIVTAGIALFSYPAWQIMLGSVAVCIAAIGHIALCLEMDIKHPSVCMQGDEEASTTSKSTPYALLSGLFIGFVMGLILILLSTVENVVMPYILLIALSVIFA